MSIYENCEHIKRTKPKIRQRVGYTYLFNKTMKKKHLLGLLLICTGLTGCSPYGSRNGNLDNVDDGRSCWKFVITIAVADHITDRTQETLYLWGTWEEVSEEVSSFREGWENRGYKTYISLKTETDLSKSECE